MNGRNKIIAGVVAAALLAPVAPKVSASLPAPYKDGCSGGMSWFYRSVLRRVPVWEGCCDVHDRAYGPGGTSDQRATADRRLYDCVSATGHTATAAVMWLAVRLGGTPFFPFGWRWGFEKDFGVSWWYSRDDGKGW
jgi:hypothetical protein